MVRVVLISWFGAERAQYALQVFAFYRGRAPHQKELTGFSQLFLLPPQGVRRGWRDQLAPAAASIILLSSSVVISTLRRSQLSFGVWTSARVGPIEIMSSCAFFSAKAPHSTPAWTGSTTISLPVRSLYCSQAMRVRTLFGFTAQPGTWPSHSSSKPKALARALQMMPVCSAR